MSLYFLGYMSTNLCAMRTVKTSRCTTSVTRWLFIILTVYQCHHRYTPVNPMKGSTIPSEFWRLRDAVCLVCIILRICTNEKW